MLTQVTANMTTREVQTTTPRRSDFPVALSFYVRLDHLALHAAKRTRDGIPTAGACLERAWYEVHSEPGAVGFETSFTNVCRMLGWDEQAKRRERLQEINRSWQKALTDWGRRRRERMIEELLELKAADNPAWAARHAVQGELPVPEEACI